MTIFSIFRKIRVPLPSSTIHIDRTFIFQKINIGAILQCLENRFPVVPARDLIFHLRLFSDEIKRFYSLQNFKICLRQKVTADQKWPKTASTFSFFSFNQQLPFIWSWWNLLCIFSEFYKKNTTPSLFPRGPSPLNWFSRFQTNLHSSDHDKNCYAFSSYPSP